MADVHHLVGVVDGEGGGVPISLHPDLLPVEITLAEVNHIVGVPRPVGDGLGEGREGCSGGGGFSRSNRRSWGFARFGPVWLHLES